jgi:tetratricopeptide (TPR) repeat protein
LIWFKHYLLDEALAKVGAFFYFSTMQIRLLISVLLLFSTQISKAQEFANSQHYLVDSLRLEELSASDKNLIDSCLEVFHTAKEDTNKIGALSKICENLMHESWENYQLYQYDLIKKTLDQKGGEASERLKRQWAMALNNMGFIYHSKGNIPKALMYFKKSAKVEKLLNNEHGLADTYNNIGVLHNELGQIPMAVKYFHASLKIREKLGNEKGIAESYNNLGKIHEEQHEKELAKKYYYKSLAIEKKIGNRKGEATTLLNIGLLYSQEENYKKALDYYNQSLEIENELGSKWRIANVYNNIGALYKKQERYTQALTYFENSLELDQEIENKHGVVLTLNNLSHMEFLQGNYTKAEIHASQALKLAQEIGFPDEIKNSARLLSDISEKQDKGLLALKMYKLYVKMKDSLNNEATQKAAIRQQTQYEFEKEQLIKEQEAKEQERLEEEALTRRNNIEYSLIFLGILLLFGTILSLGYVKVSTNIAEGLIFFAFLILFEFILVFLEPFLEEYTNQEPIYALLANSLIALLVFPLHAFMEGYLKKRIVKKKWPL